MTIDNEPSELGRLRLLGQRDGKETLWELGGRARRVPAGEGNDDGTTPGVFSLRTLVARGDARQMEIPQPGNEGGHKQFIDYVEPALVDYLAMAADDTKGKPFKLDVFGETARVTLAAASRVLASPVWERPGLDSISLELEVPAFLMAEGSLLIADAAAMAPVLKDLDTSQPIELRPDGLVYTAQISPPDRSAKIPTRVLLSRKDGLASVALLPLQSPASDARWREVWLAVDKIAAVTRQTHWLRLGFVLDASLPQLRWNIKRDGGQLVADWSELELQPTIADITLADQPVESQSFGPEQLLRLSPAVRVKRKGQFLEVASVNSAVPHADAHYSWAAGIEKMRLEPIALVHDPVRIREQLRQVYRQAPAAPATAVTGFLQLANGWLELPFEGEPAQGKQPGLTLPEVIGPSDEKTCQGSFILGNRRHEFALAGQAPDAAPWSVQLDEPAAYSLQIKIDVAKDALVSATIDMAGSALQARGMAWLANTCPDANDALPRASDDPAAYFDLFLQRCEGEPDDAPFLLQGLEIQAPQAGALTHKPPAVQSGASLAIRITGIAPGQAQQRAWLRHPGLPSVQTMAVTRSDAASTLPHASRALVPFQGQPDQLVLLDPVSMFPRMDSDTEDHFDALMLPDAKTGAVTLAALTLPGMELLPAKPSAYQVRGTYTLPVFDEPHARALVPPPEDEELPPPPVVTALDRAGLNSLMVQAHALRGRTRTQDSSMFPAGDFGKEIVATPGTLVPPLSWSAKVKVNAIVAGDINSLSLGLATFTQVKPAWTRNLGGDQLLSGPAKTSLEVVGGAVMLKDGDNLIGWSVQETDGTLVRDSRGVAWAASVTDHGALMAREVQVHLSGKDKADTYRLLSTRDEMLVQGVAGTRWRLAFTDVPMKGLSSMLEHKAGRETAALNGWTWTLSQGVNEGQSASAPGARTIRPLPLGPCLRFAPAAFKSVVMRDERTLDSVVIEGALVLGDNRAVAQDTLRRALITMKPDASGVLSITAIESAQQDGLLTWDLDLDNQEGLLWSGSAQLSGRLALVRDGEQAGLWLQKPRATVSFLQHVFEVALAGPLRLDRAGEVTSGLEIAAQLRKVHLAELVFDLQRARLSSVKVKGTLRVGVEFNIRQSRGAAAAASMTWFGNRIEWTASIDASRRSCVMSQPQSAGETSIFPGLGGAAATDGVACLELVSDGAALIIGSHFLELSLLHAGELKITHLIHGGVYGQQHDTLRFDGTWTHDSLIAWPDLAPWNLAANANSAMVEFATAENKRVRHQAAFDLSGHVLEGTQFGPSEGQGIALANKGLTPPTWLAEATHTLTWPGAVPQVRQVRALHALQLWSAGALGAALEDTGSKKYAFAPGYRTRYTDEFPRQGMRRAHDAWAGLFAPSLPAEFGKTKVKRAWVLLGGMTVMCRHPSNGSQHVLLHLPFAALLGSDTDAGVLRKLLAPPAIASSDSKLKMSRHDLMDETIRSEAPGAIPVGDLLETIPLREVPFARDLRPSSQLPGAALAANWFGDRPAYLPGWHVEQFQRPGRTDKNVPLPHPFARATVMLAVLRDQTRPGGQDTLSILTRHGPRTAPQDIENRTVRLQPPADRAPALIDASGGDLVIGGAGGVVVLPISQADAMHEDPKHLVALAIGRMADPAFIVRRKAQDDHAFEPCELPSRPLDPLEFAIRPLRPPGRYVTDGHLTWPESFSGGRLGKADFAIAVRPRAPKHLQAPLAMASVAGRLQTSRPMGMPFGLAGQASGPVTQTVWLEEHDRVAFERGAATQDDAAPWMQEAAVAARPLVPSTREVARAMVQMDPALAQQAQRKFQTYLPPVADTYEFSSRAGAFVEMGIRGLAARNAATTEFEPADGGPAVTRSFRRPRPMPLPENGADPKGWRRTVGWWGERDKSCLTLRGAWDCLAGPPDAGMVPRWSIYLGLASPHGLAMQGRGAAPAWRGSVLVTCVVRDGAKVVDNPAHVVLALLTKAKETSLRAGLRAGALWIDFAAVALAGSATGPSKNQLVFSPGAGSAFPGGTDFVFECGLRAMGQDLPDETVAPLTLKPKPLTALDTADFRAMTLQVRAPQQGRFALPITRRTVFFSDPAFDMRLGKVEPRSVNQPFDNMVPDKMFNAWIDRQSVTPHETAVLRVAHNLGGTVGFLLAAAVTRKDGFPEDLKFDFGAGGKVVDTVLLQQGEHYALPLSVLRSVKGGLLPGDTLVLNVTAPAESKERAQLMVPVKSRSALPPPQAMYSLLAVDIKAGSAWCSLHSGLPVPEAMTTDVVADALDPSAAPKIIRRGIFKWIAIDPVTKYEFGYSLLKSDRTTESSHIPDKLEEEII
jgi:hypothetical protein